MHLNLVYYEASMQKIHSLLYQISGTSSQKLKRHGRDTLVSHVLRFALWTRMLFRVLCISIMVYKGIKRVRCVTCSCHFAIPRKQSPCPCGERKWQPPYTSFPIQRHSSQHSLNFEEVSHSVCDYHRMIYLFSERYHVNVGRRCHSIQM